MKAYVIDDIKKLFTVKKSWKDLFKYSNSNNPFLTWEWNKMWLCEYLNNRRVLVVIVESDGAIIAIAPFMVTDRKVVFVANHLFADYMDILSSTTDKELFEKIFEKLENEVKWSKMVLATIPETSPNKNVIEEVLSERSFSAQSRCIHLNPFVDTKDNFDDYIKKRSKGLKKMIRYTKNRLARDNAAWEFCEAVTDTDKDNIYDNLIEFHLQRQIDKVGSSIFSTEKNRSFFRKLIKLKNTPWKSHIAGIVRNDKIVSASISLICGHIFYYWITSFDHSFGGASIGHFHIKHLLKKCFSEDIDRLDFMGGTEAYKLKWADDHYCNFEIRAYRNNLIKLCDDVLINSKLFGKNIKESSALCSSVWTHVSKYIK